MTDQSEKARQLVEQISADNARQGRALGFALGKFTVTHTTPVDSIDETTTIEETHHDDNH